MEILAAVVVMQLVASCLGFFMMWRKLDGLKAQLHDLHEVRVRRENVRETATAWRTQEARQPELFALLGADSGATVAPSEEKTPLLSDDPFSDAWVRPSARGATEAKPTRRETVSPPLVALDHVIERRWQEPSPMGISRDHARAILATLGLALPAIGFAFGSDAIALVVMGLLASAATLLFALKRDWQAPSWVAVVGASAWALIGAEAGAASADPVLYSLALIVTASAGLVQAGLQRRVWSGATMALAMAAAALSVCARTSFISPEGLAFGVVVMATAALGASRLRRDALHVAAFVMAGAGLVVHSGQADAAIWFTPMAAWAAAIFFGIAAVRVPALGAHGALLAATGTLAPLFAAGALAASHHTDAWTTAGAFVALALLFAGVMTMAAQRTGSVGALKLTAWILTGALTLALGAATTIALPTALGALGLGALTLGLVGADRRWAHPLWRFFATWTTLAATVLAFLAMASIGSSDEILGPFGQVALGVLAPAALLGVSAFAAQRAPFTTGALEFAAITLGLAGISAFIRVLFAGGAPALQEISFVEAGFHQTTWLAASLALAWRAEDGASDIRRAFAFLLAGVALITCVIGTALWLTPYWNERAEIAVDWSVLRTAALGFVLPALVAWGHWAYWRTEHAPKRARIALGLAGYLTAALISFEISLHRSPFVGFDWLTLGACVLVFALAGGAQFAPGAIVAPEPAAALNLDEYLKRNRRREQAG